MLQSNHAAAPGRERPSTSRGLRALLASATAARPASTTPSAPAANRRRGRISRIAGAALTALLASTLAPGAIAPAHAAVAGMSAVDPQNGFPTWYSDGNVKLQLCYMAGAGCLSEPPNPDAPASYPDNFPEEAFWFNAEATGGNLGLYEAGLEGAHVNGAVVPGEQMGFGRLRFRVNNLVAGASYTIKHPYGTNTFTAQAVTGGGGRINQTVDAGVCAPTDTTPCDWAGVGAAFLGSDARTTTSTFLTQVGAAAGTLGDINTARPVTGAPSGLNAVTITGPNAGGPGVNTLTVSQFTVQGLIFNGADAAPSTPDLVAASDSGRSSSDNITNVATPTFAGTVPGIGVTEASVQLMVDGAATPAVDGATLNGAYSLALPTGLSSGVHRVQARTPNPAYAVDPDTGLPVDATIPQFLTSGTLTFTVDTTPPPVSVVAPFPSNPSADTTPTVAFSAEAGSSVECQLLPSNAAWDPTCTSPKTYDPQLDGNYTFNVRATDAAGNLSAPATFSWRIGQPDTTAPTLSSQNPVAGATGVPLANNVTATFTEAVTGVDGTSMVLDDPAGNPVPAAVTYNATNRTATLNPTNNLASGTRYTLSLSNTIEDASGNAYLGSTSSFTTADTAAPTVTSRTPASGAVGFATTGNVTATFNEAVTGVTGTSFTLSDAAGGTVPAAVTYNATTRVATLNPTADLDPNSTYTAELSGAIADTSGNPLAASSWDFTTGAAADTTAPTVSSRTPVSAATGVAAAGNVTATFNEAVQGVSGTTFTLKNAAGTSVAGTVSYDPATRVATLDPTADLAASTTYTATLTGGTAAIRDASNNALTTTTWSFTTAAAPDVTAPTVSTRTPASAATGVGVTSPVTATFNEAVQGVSGTTFTLKNASGTAVAGTVAYNATTRVATLTPTASLVAGTTYTATLTGGVAAIRDAANNPLATASWSFTTAPAAPTDITAPTVSTRTPASAATGVAVASPVTATFNEAVQGVSGTTFTLKNAAGTAVAGTVAYNATTRVATLTPTASLAAGTTYTATLTGGAAAIRDAANNPLVTTSWTFTTAAATSTDTVKPTATVAPTANSTAASQTGNITATFSEAVTGVAPATFTLKNAATGAAVTATSVTYNATTRVATFDPSITLAADTKYTASLTAGIKDTASNTLTATSWTFTTGPRPTVTARTPGVSATSASTTANLTATFSEAVSGVAGATFTLKNAAGTAVAGTVTYNATTRVATFDPTATLANDTKYTAQLIGGTTAIRDAAGNPLGATTWTFTTGPAPTVTARTPAVNATAVGRTANVTATFSEAVTGTSATTVTLKDPAGVTQAAVVSYNATTRVVTLNPNATLVANTKYTVTLTGSTTAIRDTIGNPLATTTWSFTTGAA